MKKSSSSNRKLFYVVQFLELPFKDIDRNVCVPHSWIVPSLTSDERAVVAYPNDEDPLTIRDRVKKRERLHDEWRFYVADIEYVSDTFEDAANWIKMHNDNKKGEIETSGKDMRDSQPKPILNRKLRSASRLLFSGSNFNKPLVSVEPCKNSRKPLPRISIRLPPQLKMKKTKSIQQVKVDEIAGPVSRVISHTRAVPERLKENHSIMNSDNQLIQRSLTRITATLDHQISSEQTSSSEQALPAVISGNKSVLSDQTAPPKLPRENKPSRAGQIGEQALSLMDVEIEFEEDNHEDDDADHAQFKPQRNAPFPGKTLANSPELVSQSESVNKRLVPHKHSRPELRLQGVPAEQFKEADVNPRNQLFKILKTPVEVSGRSGTPNQLFQDKYFQSAFMTSTSAAYQNFQLQGTNGGSSTEVSYNHQGQRSQEPINNTPFLPSIKKKSSSVTKDPAAKKMCLQNITGNTLTRLDPSCSPAQLHLLNNSVVNPVPLAQKHTNEGSRQAISNARSQFEGNAIDLSVSQQGMMTSAAQNLSYLTQRSCSLVDPPDIQHHLLVQKHYLEQIARPSSKLERPNIGHTADRHAYLPDATNRECILERKPNLFGQTNHLLSQNNNQYVLLNENSMQKVPRNESLRGLICGADSSSAPIAQNFGSIIQFPTQNLPTRPRHNFKNLQGQDATWYQDLSGPSLQFYANHQETKHQGVIKEARSSALPQTPSQPSLNAQQGYPFLDPRVRIKQNQTSTKHQILDLVASGNLVNKVELTSVSTEVRTAPLPDRLDEMPSARPQEVGIAYKNPDTKKLVVDQATGMDPEIVVDHCEDEAAEPSDINAPQVADSEFQTDEYFVQEQESPYQEADFESETSTHYVLDRGECGDHPRDDTVSNSRPTSPQNPQTQQRLAVEQEMLNTYGTLFTQMGASFHHTRDLFNHLRNSIIKCAELYESLLEKLEKSNEVELRISTSLPNDKTSKTSKQNISKNSNAENISGINSASKLNHSLKNTFVLPPEYDPNDPKWTRKYREKGPGLVELIPRTNVYVSKKELENCKRESKDCRTLAQMLLTEVFSRNALRVCSLTGSKAKAFTSFNLDVRPGLDEDARIILLTFVERHGAKRGWKVEEQSAIINSIRAKILEVRKKHAQVTK